MNPGLVVKLRPLGPWRIGPDSGARNRVDTIYHSDSLYSAVTGAMGLLGSLEEWLAATARETAPAVCFSSCFPFLDEIGFVVPPRTIWPPASPSTMSARVRWKSARFVPLGIVQAILAGQTLNENHWSVDGASECLVPAGRPGPFRTGLRWNAAVDRLTGVTERHSMACIEFRPGSGLWTIVSFHDDAARARWSDPVKAAFRLLADSGFGGERSRGWGRSATPEFIEGTLPELILPPAPERIAQGPDVPIPPIQEPPEPSPVPEPPIEDPEPPPPDPTPEPEPDGPLRVVASVTAPPEVTPLAFEPEHAEVAAPPSEEAAAAIVPGEAAAESTGASPAVHAETGETESAAPPTEDATSGPAKPPSEEAATAIVPAQAATESAEASGVATEASTEPAAPPTEAAASAPAKSSLGNAAASHWLLSLFTPAAGDTVDWQRGNYTLVARGGRVESPAGAGALKKQLNMIAEGSVVVCERSPSGSAPDVAPDGFAHPVFRAGFALAIPLPGEGS